MISTVLIVDDVGFVRDLVRRVCEARGLKVLDEAEDGVQAVEKIKLLEPDLVILDLVLPRMNGIEVLEELYESSEIRPVVLVCSSLEDNKVRQRCAELGVLEFLKKPFSKKQMEDVLDQLKNKERMIHHG